MQCGAGPLSCRQPAAGLRPVSVASHAGGRHRSVLRAPSAAPQLLAALPRRRRAQEQQSAPRRRGAPPQAALGEALLGLAASPHRDVLAGGLSVVGATLLIKFFDSLEKAGVVDQKLSRKLVHTLAGPLFVLCWPLFSAAPQARLLAAAVPSLNGLRLLLVGNGLVKDNRAVQAMTRTGDPRELLRGPLYYVIVLVAVTALCWRESAVGMVVTSLMCGGDGLADIVGRRLGAGNPLPWNPAKSWAGSIAMFLGGFGMAVGFIALYCRLGFLAGCDLGATVASVAGIAAVATLVESLPINQTLDDNLSVPAVSALMGTMLLQVMVML